MLGNTHHLMRRCAFIAVVLGALAHASSTPPAASGSSIGSIWQPTNIAWPPGLTGAADEVTGGLVAAITTDIDADGDLDVVATDQALNLLVWVNDGAGHFTRQHPKHSGGVSTSAPEPTLERRAGSLALSTLTPTPAAGLGPRLHLDARLAGAKRPPTSDRFVLPPTAFARSPRAPPSGTVLT